MARTLILKFQDDLLLRAEDLGAFRLIDNYTELARQYAQIVGYQPTGYGPSFGGKQRRSPFVDTQLKALEAILGVIRLASGSTPEFLFNDLPPEAPLQVVREIRRPRPDNYRRLSERNAPPASEIPNLYNYFRLPLPDSFADSQLLDALERLGHFMTLWLGNLPLKKLVKSVLAAAYVAEDPAEMAITSPDVLSPTASNQTYLQAMGIPASANQGQNVGLSILEVHGWDLSHPQFEGSAYPVLFPARADWLTPADAPFSLTAPGQLMNLSLHGTKMLGILRARQGDHNPLPNGPDLCRGLVPQATFRLASCLSRLTLNTAVSPPRLTSKRFNEAAALLQLLNQSQRGDVVLIEVGLNGQQYPLEVAPAIYDLVKLATQREITVVAAAGNLSMHLPVGTAASQGVSAFVASARKALLAANLTDGKKAAALNNFLATYAATPSGSILVGSALQPPAGAAAATRLGGVPFVPGSSWGPRVKVYAQGEHILTTVTDEDGNLFGTTGQTSGAAAIIAGVVTSLQGLAKQNGVILTPAQLAQLLTAGLPVNSPDGTPTGGVIPNYGLATAMLEKLF